MRNEYIASWVKKEKEKDSSWSTFVYFRISMKNINVPVSKRPGKLVGRLRRGVIWSSWNALTSARNASIYGGGGGSGCRAKWWTRTSPWRFSWLSAPTTTTSAARLIATWRRGECEPLDANRWKEKLSKVIIRRLWFDLIKICFSYFKYRLIRR